MFSPDILPKNKNRRKTIMKRIFALALTVMMVAALAVSASAYYLDRNEGGALIEKTVNKGYTPVVIDGKMSEGEYCHIPIDYNTEISIATYDEAAVSQIDFNSNELYMSYDENYVYLFITTTAKGHHNGCDDNVENIWAQYGIQVSLADVNDDDSSMRLESGYALSSDTGNNIHRVWNDGQGLGYEDICTPGTDYVVVKDGDKMNYEVRVPYEAFQAEKAVEGDKIRLSIVWATGTSDADLSDQYIHTQFAYGITGDPGKDVTGHAVMTLGPALEAPAAEAPEAEAPADAGEAAAVVAAAPVTADAGIVAAVAVMAVAACVVLSKKH